MKKGSLFKFALPVFAILFLTELSLSSLVADMWVSRPIGGLTGDVFLNRKYKIIVIKDKVKRYEVKVIEDDKPKRRNADGMVEAGTVTKKKDNPIPAPDIPTPGLGGLLSVTFLVMKGYTQL